MAATLKVYANALKQALGGNINFPSGTVKMMLATSSYTPSQSAHVFKSDVTNEVAAGGGYTAGGIALTGKTLSVSGLTLTIDADDVVWSSSTITARYGIVYLSTGTDSTSPLICYIDFGADTTDTSGTFTVTFNA